MAGKQSDENLALNLNVPLLLLEKKPNVGETRVETDRGGSRNGTTSLFNTCINSLNALSGPNFLLFPFFSFSFSFILFSIYCTLRIFRFSSVSVSLSSSVLSVCLISLISGAICGFALEQFVSDY
ncbi:amino acid transporter AVT1I-like [Senna tora]|uniref:Amino acid transporter AVT1I-like n=1 Tax=Senna tora TaxID=362788 RepID=A0A834SET0_9FABA|nr:amino acid transporter AVT1I-like [Senna tora]